MGLPSGETEGGGGGERSGLGISSYHLYLIHFPYSREERVKTENYGSVKKIQRK
jgi:hypothetical protein